MVSVGFSEKGASSGTVPEAGDDEAEAAWPERLPGRTIVTDEKGVKDTWRFDDLT